MEIDNLGARCMLENCRVLDYLPVKCNDCGGTFCSDHQTPAGHSCLAQSTQGSKRHCPSCGRDVGTGANALANHLRNGCAGRVRTDPRCAHAGCGRRDALAVACPQCSRMFCIEHRHLEVHGCSRGPSRRAKPAPSKTPVQREVVKATGSKPRTDFMNTPSNPIGDARVDEDDRFLMAVYFPIGSGLAARYMYFSKRHSAGKILDEIVSRVHGFEKLKGGGRYHLYAVKSGGVGVNLLPHITPIRDLPVGTLLPGDSLVIETDDSGLSTVWTTALAAKSVTGTVSSMFKKQLGSPSNRLFRSRIRNSNQEKSKCSIV